MNQRSGFEQEKPAQGGYMKNCHFHSLSWTAVMAGAFVAIGLAFLINLFGIGIGLSAYGSTSTETGAHALAFGGYIAMIFGAMVVMFVAGGVSGMIARPHCATGCHGILYGFLTWCL